MIDKSEMNEIELRWGTLLKDNFFFEARNGVFEIGCCNCGLADLYSPLSIHTASKSTLWDWLWEKWTAFHTRHLMCQPRQQNAPEPAAPSNKEDRPIERFPSGSIRDSQEGRGRYDLIPPGPYKRLALRTELGAKRYGDNNWMKGQPIKRYLNSLKRHITEYELGDRSEDHLAAACWNLFSAMWTEDEIKAGRLKDEPQNK